MEGAIGGVGSGSLRPADVIDRDRVDAHLLDILALFQEERAALAHLEAHLLFFAPLGYCVVTVGDTQPCPRFPLLPSLPPRAAVFCWKPAPPPRSLPPRT